MDTPRTRPARAHRHFGLRVLAVLAVLLGLLTMHSLAAPTGRVASTEAGAAGLDALAAPDMEPWSIPDMPLEQAVRATAATAPRPIIAARRESLRTETDTLKELL
ncbi:hypothetical protein ACIQWA_06735 [Kitasatospora sp. NPDC098652]|uniref:hypothetical protein n=1 Tax=Kitasatospora sp. NPDC098652 TaxID=3364095 RepID=UPI0037FBC3F2